MYSLVDINLNAGLGDVDPLEKNVPLITYDITNPAEVDFKCSEKITAVKADDCSSFLVISHFTNKFYAFKVDVNGVNTTPVISEVGPEVPVSGYRRNALGYIKASPDGSRLVVAHLGFATTLAGEAPGGVYLFDFDNDTGIVSNEQILYGPENGDSPYGVEFSAENRKVYATINAGANGSGPSSVVQWDLESADIPASQTVIHTSNTFTAGALQLGINRKIYRAQVNLNNPNATARFLGVIENPEANGTAANYNETGILVDVNGGFQNLSRIGLPPFIQSLFNTLEMPELFKNEDELRALWSVPSTRMKLLKQLEEAGFPTSQLLDIQEIIDAKNSDLFDVLEFVKYALKPIARSTRAKVARSVIESNLEAKQLEFVDFLVSQYVESGVGELEEAKLETLLEIKYQDVFHGVKVLGDGEPSKVRNLFLMLQKNLYLPHETYKSALN